MPQTGFGSVTNNTYSGGQRIFTGRVKFILLNDVDNSEIWNQEGQWSALGGIKFELINNPAPKEMQVEHMDFAKPLFPNNKVLPTLNELVYILGLPSTNVQNNITDVDQYYYFQPINLWNSIHHNAMINSLVLTEGQQQDYEQSEAGLVRQVSDSGTEINLGKTFKERFQSPGGNLGAPKNLQPFEGDILYEGRWGQTIRLGSTVTDSNPTNPWSENGENGDPIMIIKNGNHDDGKDTWIPQVEDINKDLSSIYLSSTQKLPINVASKHYKSYETEPESPNEYVEEQVILTSNRLLFNARKDSILLSAEKSINLNTNDSVNIDSFNSFIVDTSKIHLGSKEADEPVILGNEFLNDLQVLLGHIQAFSNVIPITVIAEDVPNPAITPPAIAMGSQAGKMLSKIEAYKSKVAYTQLANVGSKTVSS